MILLSIARAADVTWISEPPSAPMRVEITAASWDPLSRRLIDVVLEQDLEVVVLMDQQPSARAGLQTLHPKLLVARTHLDDGVLGGVPTSGCTENGNIVALPPFALEGSIGHTRFVWSDVRPIVEGIGIFPDIWLDTEDPVSFLARLP